MVLSMSKRILTECPYCHRKVSIIGANVLKTKGEHVCKGCKCISNVVIHTALYAIASIVVVLSLLILVLYTAMGDHGDYHGILYVFAPFVVFYLAVPFFVRLEPCTDKSAVNKLKRKINPVPAADVQTRHPVTVMPEQPIELDVSDDFRRSFADAKKMSHHTEAEEVSSEPVAASQEGILDLDISGPSQTEAEEDVRIYEPADKPAEDAPEENGEVSFIFGGKGK